MRAFPLIAILLVACSGDVTSPEEDLQVVTTVTPAQFRAGDNVKVTVTVTNRGFRWHTISGNTCPEPWVVTTADLTVVGPPPRICNLPAIRLTLRPGESTTFSNDWRGSGMPRQSSAFLVPGDYVVRGFASTPSGLVWARPVNTRIMP